VGEAELKRNLLVIHAEFIFYGDAASEELSLQVAKDIEDHWNEPRAKIQVRKGFFSKKTLDVRFNIKAEYDAALRPEVVYENSDPRKNYFRIEEYITGNVSFVDAINCNTGYFKLDNLLNNSTTAAHEFVHTICLVHPDDLDIRGKGTPGIMYPRGTFVDPQFQYSPDAIAGEAGGTLNPFTRKVLQEDIVSLQLNKLDFDQNGLAVVGDFTSVWHEKHQPS
jgi:hypothetical protein